MCTADAVTACPGPPPAGHCEEIYCGGRLWEETPQSYSSYIPYRIWDPQGLFSESYKTAIRGSASAWSQAVGGIITFAECSSCSGRFVSVIPGDADGIVNPDAWEELLPVPVDAAHPDRIPMHRIAHQWGHVIGLDDLYKRPDRDRYVRFDPAVWCANGAALPPQCASTPTAGSAPIASGTFGVYDERSKMNGLEVEGICGATQPEESSAAPTIGDASSLYELFFQRLGPWAPFRPIAHSVSPTQPLDYQLAPGVDPVGGPAIAEWAAPGVEIVARGSDGGVYSTHNDLSGSSFVDWADWTKVGDSVNADPALVLAGPDTLHLAVRSATDGKIHLRTRRAGVWGSWASLGAPAVGAASAPAIAAYDEHSLTVLVRGADDLIYAFECLDPGTMCAASAAATDAWSSAPDSPAGGFRGKPSAVWWPDGSILYVSAVGSDNVPLLIGGSPGAWGGWIQSTSLTPSPSDPDPSVAVTQYFGTLTFYGRDARGLLEQGDWGANIYVLGGLVISSPAAIFVNRANSRIDVAALVDDHGHPGVWVKFVGDQYRRQCNYNAPGTCAECGCDLPGKPYCNY